MTLSRSANCERCCVYTQWNGLQICTQPRGGDFQISQKWIEVEGQLWRTWRTSFFLRWIVTEMQSSPLQLFFVKSRQPTSQFLTLITLSKVVRCLQNKSSVALCLDCIKSSGTFFSSSSDSISIDITDSQTGNSLDCHCVWVSFSKCLFDLFIDAQWALPTSILYYFQNFTNWSFKTKINF